MGKIRQYVVYEKICIVCMKPFETTRASTMCCGKACRNRLRYMPQRLINSLMEKNSIYTSSRKYMDSIVSSPVAMRGAVADDKEVEYLKALANAEAVSRGIKPSSPDNDSVSDNLKYINTTDPAALGSNGFNVVTTTTENNEISDMLSAIENKTEEQHDNQQGNSDGNGGNTGTDNSGTINTSSPDVNTSSKERHITTGRGIRRIGGLKAS